MVSHTTRVDLERYLAGTLDGEAASRLERHVTVCGSCRTLVHERVAMAARSIRLDIEQEAEPHPDFSDLQAVVDRTGDSTLRDAVEAHLAICEVCAADHHALAAERDRLDARPGTSRKDPVWTAAAAAAALIAVGIGAFWWSRPTGSEDRARPAPADKSAAVVRPPRLDVVDRGRPVRVEADGRLTGVAGVADADTAVVVEAVSSGRLPAPLVPAGLSEGADPLMGRQARLAVGRLSPAGVAVETDCPAFAWPPIERATTYTVAVLDGALRMVAQSPPLTILAWTPASPLARGETYQWQVTASTPGGPVVVPAPPAPVARFHVVDTGTAASLQAARAAGSRLVLGILLSRAGVREEAARELSALAAENPESAIAASLAAQAQR